MIRRLDETTVVAGQIQPSDVAEAAALGVRTIVNNRPDGEEPGQPSSALIEAAARAAGLAYVHIPIGSAFPPESVAAMAEAIDAPEGEVLAFCRSGTRSTYLWAMARARGGADPDDLLRRAAAAGYDLSPIRPSRRPPAS